ncbi:DUF1836 domain-containing protein [Oceanobacillus saliphilus]|uniref:DUF1836 domain-containing protein n=1 Tax=Oceanobacillus saliphilus TaxID=2925834 RepID=UPI00201D42F4|nr:DUF1836 domain-containing protein [Oceanobacillus saliphilus]
MENNNGLIDSLNMDTQLTLDDIPNLDLYMDQVIQLFENKFAASKRNDEEKVLTKTMINNYAKGKLFFPIKNKKYSKDHLILISLIYQMKSALSINDVKKTLDDLNTKIVSEDFNLHQLYRSYLDLMEKNSTMFIKNVEDQMIDAKKEAKKLTNDHDEEYLENVLLVATFSSMSNYYRRAAEKIVDDMKKKEGEKNEA